MRRVKKELLFKTEAEMCARFISQIGRNWTAYPETCGWDILLVRPADGFQIGIQAKLKLNADVIGQAVERAIAWYSDHAGPDCRAVLVPYNEMHSPLRGVAGYIGLTVVGVRGPDDARAKRSAFDPSLPGHVGGTHRDGDWHEFAPDRRHELPDYVPDVPAGAPAPLQLTQWKIGAIKVAVTLELRGCVTRADFKHFRVDHRRFVAMEWIKNTASPGGPGVWVANRMPDFRAQHPRNYEEIKADAETWMLPAMVALGGQRHPARVAEQGAML